MIARLFPRASLRSVVLVTALCGACNGSVEGGAPGSGRGGNPPMINPGTGSGMIPESPGVSTPPPVAPIPPGSLPPTVPAKPPGSPDRCDIERVAPRTLRRLTTAEFDATVRAAFGLGQGQWSGPRFLPDPAAGDGFTNNAQRLTIGDEYALRVNEAAEEIADSVTSAANLPRLLPCAAVGGLSCAVSFLDGVASRLYRRPLTAVEKQRYLTLYEKIRQKDEFKTWLYSATVGLITSPNTLYRSELGEPLPDGRFRLSPYEVASQLSYAYAGGPPTPELLQLAATNRLATADQVEMAARNLVLGPDGKARPAFRALLARFSEQWLNLSPIENLRKDPTLFPAFTPEVQEALARESREFLTSVILDDRGKPSDLMLAPHTLVDGVLARFYGFGQSAGTAFVRTARPAGWGLGLLSQGALLAIGGDSRSTSPTKRGHLVRERILCNKVPPPPPVVSELPEPTAAQTTRQRYETLHVADPSCKGCHALMDHIGFAFEHLDATGRFREREGAFDIDDSGTVFGTSAGNLPFRGPEELARALAPLPETADCLADFITGHTFGMDHSEASCLAKTASDQLRAGSIGVLDYYIAMARGESFRIRAP
jgi:hypothetical protein